MTRFQASGPRIDYTPVQSEKPFKQIVGLYDMWQSLSPETREWIGNWFRRRGKVSAEEPSIDPALLDMRNATPPEFASDEAALGATEMLTKGYRSPYRKPMRMNWDGIVIEADETPELPSIEEIVAAGQSGPTYRTESGEVATRPRYRAIAGMSPAVEQFFTGDSWRVR